MPNEPFEDNLDQLLADLHQLLDEAPAETAEPEEEMPLPEAPEETPMPEETPEILHEPLPEETLEPEQPVMPVEKPRPPSWTDTQRLPKHVAKLQKNQAQAYADWLYEQGKNPASLPKNQQHRESSVQVEMEPPQPPKKKKRHGFRNFVIILLLLAVAVTAVTFFLLPKQPMASEGLGARKPGVSTLLLAGLDQSGARSDTLMLLTINRPDRQLSLVSIPRDTLINGTYSVPKINSVYGANNGGQEGIDMLMTRVGEIIGFRPDGYVLLELTAFVKLVDALGGVEFQVPVDMFYNDPSQDLFINLPAGLQNLTGEEAMGLVRFRSGYADADLGRIKVQREFLSAMLKKVVNLKTTLKAPKLLKLMLDNTYSDLTTQNLLWLAESALKMDYRNIRMVTLPGNPRYLNDISYYILDPASVVQTVNSYCNPYEMDVVAADLSIRTE